MILNNIPGELRQLQQWVCAGENKEPLDPRSGQPAKVNDPSTWGTFDDAVRTGFPHIGFVLTKEDPYTIIDLDDPTTIKLNGVVTLNPDLLEVERIAARHTTILNAFATYAELSQSGKGVHIVMRGAVPSGVRRQKVEIYSELRYIICTGNIIRNIAIADCQPLLSGLWNEIAIDGLKDEVELQQVESTITDDQLYHMASTAVNAEKFNQLWQGNWEGNPMWPSQSEADFALLAMLSYYTPDDEQVRRMFRWSGLARHKTNRTNYHLDKALKSLRAKYPYPLKIDFSKLKSSPYATDNEQGIIASVSTGTDSGPQIDSAVAVGDAGPRVGNGRPEATNPQQQASGGIEFPPGFVGELAQYVFDSSIRPVREIALATAIALAAGVVARAFNVSGQGLNQYILVLARTGRGKDATATGTEAMVTAARSTMPMIDEFIGPGAFASGQALIRTMDKSPCFVSILGECGLTLQQLCSPNANAAFVSYKRALLDLYNRSGWNKTLRPSVYSDSEKNTKLIQAPNLSILGETTPELFYNSLDSLSIADGLLTRFSIFEYNGIRVRRNRNAGQPPPPSLLKQFTALASIAMQAQTARVNCPVQLDAAASDLCDQFDEYADDKINSAKNEDVSELWNRAHLKVLKLSALIAVGVNPHQPIITRDHAAWAMRIISSDIEKLVGKFSEGDIGTGDVRMEVEVKRAVKEYLNLSRTERRNYDVAEKVIEYPIIPYTFLRRRLRLLSIFKNDRRGATNALKQTLDELVNGEVLARLNSMQAREIGLQSAAYITGTAWR